LDKIELQDLVRIQQYRNKFHDLPTLTNVVTIFRGWILLIIMLERIRKLHI